MMSPTAMGQVTAPTRRTHPLTRGLALAIIATYGGL
jgi:hypothetical protein